MSRTPGQLAWKHAPAILGERQGVSPPSIHAQPTRNLQRRLSSCQSGPLNSTEKGKRRESHSDGSRPAARQTKLEQPPSPLQRSFQCQQLSHGTAGPAITV
jgi:hypothetical protein